MSMTHCPDCGKPWTEHATACISFTPLTELVPTNDSDVIAAAEAVRELWAIKPVANDPDWHSTILALIQAVNRRENHR